MGWKSVLFGFAAVVALCLGSLAQSSVTAAAPPALRTSDPPPQPRYATMIPPMREEDVEPTAGSPPVAAPTARVTVSQADPGTVEQSGDASLPGTLPRYSTMEQPKPIEQVTVTGLRPSEDTLYRLGVGDKLRVTVFNEGDLSGEFVIDGQGYLRLPLIGQVVAAGLTTFGLEGRVTDQFVRGGFLVNPRISIEIMTYRPFYIMGEVAKPGEYAYVNAMTVPNAIALAGGYTDRAVESTIWVRHQGDKEEAELAADETTRIYPGDVIRVRRTTYWTVMSFLSPIISPFSSIVYLLK